MQVQSAMASDVGRERENNEDCALVDPSLDLYVVCDGMGGHAAGEVASKLAIDTIQQVVQQYLAETQTPETPQGRANALVSLMREAVQEANRRVYQLSQDPPTRGAGTTCTAVLVHQGKAALAHVGDSRAYLIRQSQAHQLSTDHTFAAEAIAKGIVTPEQVGNIPEAACLTRAVGPQPSVVVDTLLFDLLSEDTLILCSDGLHGYLQSEQQLAELCSVELSKIPENLVKFALDRGGQDNVTAVVVQMRAEGTDEVRDERTTQILSDFEALRHIDLFSELTYAELSSVSQRMQSIEFEPNDEILREGDTTQNLYVLVEGRARVYRGGELIAMLSTGSHFGEMALLTTRPRTATVVADESCRVLILDKHAFFKLSQANAVFGVKFLWKFAQTLSLRLEESYGPRPKLPANDDTLCSPFATTLPPPNAAQKPSTPKQTNSK